METIETLKYIIEGRNGASLPEDSGSSEGSGTAAMRWLLSTNENRGEISRDRDRCVRVPFPFTFEIFSA